MVADSAVVERGPRSRAESGSLLLAVAGLGVSAYLTVEHYAAPRALACPATGAINCAKVTTSSWAMVGPVPLALLGTVFFAVMAALCLPAAWRNRRLDAARLAGAGGAVAAALYLVWVELFRLQAICLWCTAVHVASLALLVTVLWRVTGRADDLVPASAGPAVRRRR